MPDECDVCGKPFTEKQPLALWMGRETDVVFVAWHDVCIPPEIRLLVLPVEEDPGGPHEPVAPGS